jgi:hypothetical protein
VVGRSYCQWCRLHCYSCSISEVISVVESHSHLHSQHTNSKHGRSTVHCLIDHISEDSSENRHLALIGATTNFDDTIHPPHVLQDVEICLQHAFLSPLNVYVNEFNDKILEKLPGDFREYRRQTSRSLLTRCLESYSSSDSLKGADHTPLNAPEHTPDYLAMLTHPEYRPIA